MTHQSILPWGWVGACVHTHIHTDSMPSFAADAYVKRRVVRVAHTRLPTTGGGSRRKGRACHNALTVNHFLLLGQRGLCKFYYCSCDILRRGSGRTSAYLPAAGPVPPFNCTPMRGYETRNNSIHLHPTCIRMLMVAPVTHAAACTCC